MSNWPQRISFSEQQPESKNTIQVPNAVWPEDTVATSKSDRGMHKNKTDKNPNSLIPAAPFSSYYKFKRSILHDDQVKRSL